MKPLVAVFITIMLLSACISWLWPSIELYEPANDSTLYPPVTFKWKAIDEAEKYEIYVSKDQSSVERYDESSKVGEITKNTFTLKSLSSGTYYWRVRAKNGKGEVIGESPVWTFSISLESMDVYYPYNGDEVYLPVTLVWETVSGAYEYKIYLSTDEEKVENLEDSAIVKQVKQENLTISYYHTRASIKLSNLEVGKKYYWRVAAKNAGKFIAMSGIRYFQTVAKGINIYKPLDGEELYLPVTFEWEDIQGAEEYEVYLSTDTLKVENLEGSALVGETSETHLELSQLKCGEVYYWRVAAINSEGKIFALSNITSFRPIFKIELLEPLNSSDVYSPVTFKWNDVPGAKSYELYVSRYYSDVNELQDSVKLKETSATSLTIELNYGDTYYWRIVAKDDKGRIMGKSDIWSFYILKSYKIQLYDLRTYLPNLISLFVQIYKHGQPAADLKPEDFVIMDDGEELAFRESYQSMKKAELLNYKFKTVIAVDVSGSISYDDLEKIKEALREIVENMAPFQEIAIIKFAGDVDVVIDFTSNKEELLEAIDNIDRVPVGATDLFGAVIEGVRMWYDKFSISEVIMGMLVVLTDGVDTAHKYTLEDALAARGNKKVFTVGVGTEIDEEVLKELGNEGYINIESFEELVDTFKQIQNYILDYVSSFYLVYYLSPRREGWHTVELHVGDAEISREYYSNGFRDPIVNVEVTEISTDSLSATVTLKTVVKIDSEDIEEFSFVNPQYTLYGDHPEIQEWKIVYPNTEYYDYAVGNFSFTVPEYEGTITILDEKYQVIGKLYLNLK